MSSEITKSSQRDNADVMSANRGKGRKYGKNNSKYFE